MWISTHFEKRETRHQNGSLKHLFFVSLKSFAAKCYWQRLPVPPQRSPRGITNILCFRSPAQLCPNRVLQGSQGWLPRPHRRLLKTHLLQSRSRGLTLKHLAAEAFQINTFYKRLPALGCVPVDPGYCPLFFLEDAGMGVGWGSLWQL